MRRRFISNSLKRQRISTEPLTKHFHAAVSQQRRLGWIIPSLTEEVIVLLDQQAEKMDDSLPGGFALDVADGRILK